MLLKIFLEFHVGDKLKRQELHSLLNSYAYYNRIYTRTVLKNLHNVDNGHIKKTEMILRLCE